MLSSSHILMNAKREKWYGVGVVALGYIRVCLLCVLLSYVYVAFISIFFLLLL